MKKGVLSRFLAQNYPPFSGSMSTLFLALFSGPNFLTDYSRKGVPEKGPIKSPFLTPYRGSKYDLKLPIRSLRIKIRGFRGYNGGVYTIREIRETLNEIPSNVYFRSLLELGVQIPPKSISTLAH